MRSTRSLILLAAMAAALVLTGCSGGGSSPTSPPDVQPTVNLSTTVTIISVKVLQDGDGIEGRGEFYFWRQVSGSGRGWSRDLSPGEIDPVDWTVTLGQNDYRGEGLAFGIEFRCTEYDQDILGNIYADSDMDDRHATANYVMSPDLTESNYITLGNDKCKVRMYYKINSTLEEAAPTAR